MEATKIVELRALCSLREIYEESEVIKINSNDPKYICLLSKLKGYKSPYFLEKELECWEGRECTISGNFQLSAKDGIQVSTESIRLYPLSEPFTVLLTTKSKYSNKKNIGDRLLERYSKMLSATKDYFEKNNHNIHFKENLIDHQEELSFENSEIPIYWKSVKFFWFEECVVIGKEGVYSALAIEMSLKRSLTSILLPENYFDNYVILIKTKLHHILGLVNLVIKLVSSIRNIFNSNSYLPIFFSTDFVLFDIGSFEQEDILNIDSITVTDIGELTESGVIEYSTVPKEPDKLIFPLSNVINYNKYLSPEISIAYFIDSLFKINRRKKGLFEDGIQTIYDEFDIETLKDVLFERIKNRWQSLIFSGDIIFKDRNNIVHIASIHDKFITNMIMNNELNLTIRIGMPSVVFSIGLLISKIFGGKDLLHSCDNDILHSIDCLCEWNSCGNIVPFLGRVKEDNVMNSLTGRRNQSVIDVLPGNALINVSGIRSDLLLNKIHKLLWGCLNFVPCQRLTLGQVEHELRQIKNEIVYIYQKSTQNPINKKNGRYFKRFKKLKMNIGNWKIGSFKENYSKYNN